MKAENEAERKRKANRERAFRGRKIVSRRGRRREQDQGIGGHRECGGAPQGRRRHSTDSARCNIEIKDNNNGVRHDRNKDNNYGTGGIQSNKEMYCSSKPQDSRDKDTHTGTSTNSGGQREQHQAKQTSRQEQLKAN